MLGRLDKGIWFTVTRAPGPLDWRVTSRVALKACIGDEDNTESLGEGGGRWRGELEVHELTSLDRPRVEIPG